ncbi:MAG: toprim domain-containing protein, partial [Nitrosopumilaceae archaeon]|nr:toprim domain-containing protein [Nitrosopumilaceae archaeon]NIU86059.1 toprim domain-containing protein [Nitrosopumilaceae archaeon]NIV64810.1 toprim domain-containing protein [Nitrosopumilaceae archaeon]NIX60273.1 toprim domain-containing protein [Nitrosopumilaceae archaeon]
TIVEGVFDLFKCNDNATTILGSTLDTDYKLFEKIVVYNTPILLAFDNDKTGQRKAMKIAAKLREYDI